MAIWAMIALGAGAVLAGDGYRGDVAEPLHYGLDHAVPVPQRERTVQLGVGLRARTLRVPAVVLDQRYTDIIDPEWSWSEPRPDVVGTAIGLEYLVRGRHANGTFYAEYLDSGLAAGYWDRRDTSDPFDGTFLDPGRAFGLIAVGAMGAYEAHLLRSSRTAGALGVSLLVGGGLGIGAVVGRIDAWGPDGLGNPGYDRYLSGQRPDPGLPLPPIVPMVDVQAGLRLTLGERLRVDIEGGLHTAPFVGGSLGVLY